MTGFCETELALRGPVEVSLYITMMYHEEGTSVPVRESTVSPGLMVQDPVCAEPDVTQALGLRANQRESMRSTLQ